MMKAIRINKDNKQKLEEQYTMDEGTLELSSGLYLVAGFGDKQYEGLLTKAALEDRFWVTGRPLDNGYFEVFPKPVTTNPLFSN